MWTYDARHLTEVSAALKERFTNLTVVETLKLATSVCEAVKRAENENEVVDRASR